MAQRNPMNDRYMGDGPQGKTRKSAAKLKPKTEAASSVHIEKKPQTKQERKAAAKKREKQLAAKEAERQRKKQEREKQARIDAGEEVEEPKKASMGEKVKQFVAPRKDDPLQMQPKPKGKGPDTPEYKRLKRIYWTLMGVGVVAIALSLLMNFQFPEMLSGWGMMVPMGVAYVAVIGAIILDYTKIRKMQRAHQGDDSKKSPKQLKHEQERAEAARLMEENKKAQRELKRANSKIPFISKSKSDQSSEELLSEAKKDLESSSDGAKDELSDEDASGEKSAAVPSKETEETR